MRSLLFFLLCFISYSGFSQLYCTNAPNAAVLTNYGTGQIDDSVYYFCTPTVLADLEVIPEGGMPGWTFDWQEFNSNTFSWDPLSTDSNVPMSSLTGLPEGGYRVTVTDGLGDIVGCYRLWIVAVITPGQGGSLQVTATPFGCTGVALDAIYTPGTPAVTTPYYTPPPEPIIIDSTTEISVSFSAQHTYVSDLGFYLIGPASCGSPVVTLSPVNYQIGLPMNCNSGNNVDSLTFSNLSNQIFNICATPAPLSGTYGALGNGAPIDWSPIDGCDATDPGWQVQIFDCVGLDIGFLTEASVTFNGVSVCGDTVSHSYASGPIMEPILDNACNNMVAATYTVPVANTAPVTCTPVFEWNADPYFYIADSMAGPSIIIDPAPTVPTYFTYDLVQACDDPAGLCGTPGNWNNGAWYFPGSPQQLNLAGPTQTCISDPQSMFTADIPNGNWSGPGIIDPINGIFVPSVSGAGLQTLTYTVNTTCGPLVETIDIQVDDLNTPNLSGNTQACATDAPYQLFSDIPGGVWSGTGIIDPVNGIFDPSVAGPGNHMVICTPASLCAGPGVISIEVEQPILPTITVPQTVCIDAGLQNFTAAPTGGVWTGNGITAGQFDPSAAGLGNHIIGYYLSTGCTDTAWATIEVTDLVPVDVTGFSSVCLNGDSLALPDPLGGAWTGVGIVSGTNIFVAANAGVGVHDLQYTVNTACSSPGNYQVEVLPLPPSDFSAQITESCPPGKFVLTPNTQNQQWNYNWDVEGTTFNSMQAFYQTNLPGSYTVSLTVTDGNGCTSTTEMVNYLTVYPSPTAAFSTSSYSYFDTDIDFYNQSTGATTYEWIFDDLGSSTDENPSFQFPQYTADEYEVCLIAENDFGCVDTTCNTIIIERGGGCYAPNSFSPNGDSKNEIFLPVISGHLDGTYILTIYNRWGEQIFQTTDPNQGWDGTKEGSLVQDGVYVWKINYVEQSSDLPAEYKGHVTLLK